MRHQEQLKPSYCKNLSVHELPNMILRAQQACSLPVTQFNSQPLQSIFPSVSPDAHPHKCLILIICAGLKSLN